MVTSRTGTSQWLKLRKQALRLAQAQGITRCPHCRVNLDYQVSKQPNSAEVDHVIPYAKGGQDVLENTTVICRRCNQSKGKRAAPKQATVNAAMPLKTSRRW